MRPSPPEREGKTQDTDERRQLGGERSSGQTVEGPGPGSEQMRDIVQQADEKADKNVGVDSQKSQ